MLTGRRIEFFADGFRVLESACDPVNFEPNLALNLEIADEINKRKGNAWVISFERGESRGAWGGGGLDKCMDCQN